MSRILAAVGFLALLAGCAPGWKNPLYTAKDLVEDDAVLGEWREFGDSPPLVVEALGNSEYQVTAKSPQSPDERARYKFRLLNLEGHRFIDYVDPASKEHGFYRVSVFEDTAILRCLDSLWLGKSWKEYQDGTGRALDLRRPDQSSKGQGRRPGGLPDANRGWASRENASTEEVQKFVLKHVDDSTAFPFCPIFMHPSLIKREGGKPVRASDLASMRLRTFNYWYETRLILQCDAQLCWPSGEQEKLNVEEDVRVFGRGWMEFVPAKGVDPVAVESIQQVVGKLDKLLRSGRDWKEKVRMAGICKQVLSGDPADRIPAGSEKEKKELIDLVEAVNRLEKTRLVLADRYKMTFRPFTDARRPPESPASDPGR